MPHQTIFTSWRPFSMSLVVALVFLAYTVSWNFRCTLIYPAKYLKLSLSGFYEPTCVARFLLGSAPCRVWLLPALLFCRNWVISLSVICWNIIHENWRQIEWSSSASHLSYGYSLVMIVVIASFAIITSYADWDSREKKRRFAKRCDHSDGEWSGILSQSQPDLLGLWLKSGPHRRNLQVFQSQLSRLLLLAIRA